MRLKQAIFPVLLAALPLINVNPVYAYTQPVFSTCLNPQAQVQVYHPDGTHGVAGNTQTYTGVDTVYSDTSVLSSSSVMQCLCQNGGQGIQTNWWKATDLTDSEIKSLQSQGWIYIPDGSAWGLDATPYLAQNTNFSCSTSNQGSTNNNGNGSSNSQGSSDPGNNSGQSSATQAVLGAFTQLANTGNIVLLYSLLIIGTVASGLALIIRKK